MSKSRTDTYKDIVISTILRRVPGATIIIYGSRARGDDKAGSDLDISLDIGTKIDSKVLADIDYELEKSDLPIKYDLVDFHAVSEKMQNEIKREGVVWHQ